MVLRTNLSNLAKDVVSATKSKMKKPASMVREAGRMIRRNPKKSAAIGAGLAGSTGFYLYDGKRNAYEDDTTVE